MSVRASTVSPSWASSEQIRRSMRANRRVDTMPERRIRSALHRSGLRFRKDYRIDLPDLRARADIAFPRQRIAIFVDGCFWHRCPRHGSLPKRNGEFWAAKLNANAERDIRTAEALTANGWLVFRFWEHEDPQVVAEKISAPVRRALEAGL